MGLIEALTTIRDYCENTECGNCRMSAICDDCFSEIPKAINVNNLKEIEIEE